MTVEVYADDRSVRTGLSHDLEQDNTFRVTVRGSVTPPDAGEFSYGTSPDLVVVYLDPAVLADRSNLRRIAHSRQAPVLALADHPSERDLDTLRRWGAVHLIRLSTADDLLSAARSVVSAAGEPVPRTVRPGFGYEVVVIGSSTGGPQVVRTILQDIGYPFPLPILIVQHISPSFAEGFAQWLNHSVATPVELARDGEPLLPGTAYVAPGDTHFFVKNGRIGLDSSERRLFHRPSVNYLFESAAHEFGKATLGVLLTGMGRDGGDGARAIIEAGGYTIVQDEASCAVFGMPAAAIDCGGAGEILPPHRIGKRIVELCSRRRATPGTDPD